jgi:ATP-dependent DNA ligase
MLLFPFSSLHNKEKSTLVKDDYFVCEPKYYGNRVFLSHFKGEGLRIFSRKYDEDSCLPIELTEKVFIPGTTEYTGEFILDAIIVSNNVRGKMDDFYTDCEENSVSYLLSLDKEETLSFQRNNLGLKIVLLDVLYVNSCNSTVYSYECRKKMLKSIFDKYLSSNRIFEYSNHYSGDKIEFYDKCINDGYSGIVLKNKCKVYAHDSIRSRNSAIKIKKNYCCPLDDLDLFISSSYKNVIELSSFFRSGGTCYEKVMGYTPIPDKIWETKEYMRYSDLFGDYTISPKIIGSVVHARASRFSTQKNEFLGLKVNWRRGFREDKNRFDCCIDTNLHGSGYLKKLCYT